MCGLLAEVLDCQPQTAQFVRIRWVDQAKTVEAVLILSGVAVEVACLVLLAALTDIYPIVVLPMAAALDPVLTDHAG